MVGGISGVGFGAGDFARSTRVQETSLERLSTARRINRAADDAANLATVQQFLAIEASLDQGVQNLQDGQSLLQTAEGALQGTSEALIRMRELGMQAQNGTLGDADRATIQAEYDQLSAEVTRISESTGFNGRKLLDGSLQGAGAVHLADGTGGASIEIAVGGQSADDLGLAALDLGDPTALSQIDRAIDAVSSTRGRLGAVDNRLESQLSTLQVAAENTAAARSRIGDADLAVETSNLTRGRIQEDAQVALLVQGRRLQSVSVLKLLS